MSYSITVTVEDDGRLTLPYDENHQAPPGNYTIAGHAHAEGTAWPTISVSTPHGSVSSCIKDVP